MYDQTSINAHPLHPSLDGLMDDEIIGVTGSSHPEKGPNFLG